MECGEIGPNYQVVTRHVVSVINTAHVNAIILRLSMVAWNVLVQRYISKKVVIRIHVQVIKYKIFSFYGHVMFNPLLVTL